MTKQDYEIKDISLAPLGKEKIELAAMDMIVLRQIGERFKREQPLKDIRISCCLHVTKETANLARTLRDGGADVVVCSCNPDSTKDDVAASLVQDYGIPVYAIQGADRETYYHHISKALEHRPHITMDDGGDLIDELHRMNQPDLMDNVIGGSEETTTGVKRHRARAADGALKFPVIAVNDARTKHLFDNQFGIGQSTLDGILRAMNVLIGGKKVVIAGYGFGGRGLASRVQGLGGHPIVTEIDPVKALEAAIQGYPVMSMIEAAPIGDIFITVTGNIHVVDKQHFELMKDGAIVCNTGHFNVEINTDALEELKQSKTKMTDRFVEKYVMPDGRRLFLLAEGRLVNIVCGEGHPASIMDMSFSGQSLAAEYLVKHKQELGNQVYCLPKDLDDQVARMKLKAMGIHIDAETDEQLAYHKDYGAGT